MFFTLALLVASIVISIVLAPKQQTTNAGPAEVTGPKSQEGSPLPILFGCPRIKGPDVAWFGDVKTRAVKSSGGKK